jgi:hypothetical protein
MITLLADSNSLRHPGLRRYLEQSRDHAIAFSDLILIEMRKSNALKTSRNSLQIAARFPQQVFVLRRTDEILSERITSADEANGLFDYEETVELAAFCRQLNKVPEPLGLREHMAELETNARTVMARLSEEVEQLESGLIDAAKDFTQTELTQIRTGREIEDATRRKLLDLLKQTTASFIRTNQEPDRRAPMPLREATGMFAFRYSLCMLLYYLEWVRVGSTTGKKLKRRVNDVVDMQVAAMATYFNGVLSADQKLQAVLTAARAALRNLGAYVGEDWPMSASADDDGSSIEHDTAG